MFGRSIGLLYAIEPTYRQPNIAGPTIESGIADPAERFLTFADPNPAGFDEVDVPAEVKLKFNHEPELGDDENPLLILNTENDGMIDISHAEQNLQWADSEQKQLVSFPHGNHNTIHLYNFEDYLDVVRCFVEGIRS